MYAACFQIKGWTGTNEYLFSGETLMDIMHQFNNVQDISCLSMMAQQYGEESDETIDQLLDLVTKYERGKITQKEMEAIDITLSIGSMRCVEVARGKVAAAKLRQKYPKAKDR